MMYFITFKTWSGSKGIHHTDDYNEACRIYEAWSVRYPNTSLIEGDVLEESNYPSAPLNIKMPTDVKIRSAKNRPSKYRTKD